MTTIGQAPIKFDEKEHRDFMSPGRTREAIYTSVLDAARSLKPVQNTRHTLELADVDYAEPGTFTLAQQKRALLSGATLGRRLTGTWRLKDNTTGNVLEERRQTLARVPYYTDRGTVINKGSEYSVINQMRLRPGVFTRVKDNGDIEAHVNVLPGNGISHRIYLDPEKSVFYANVGQAKIPALPMLEALGIGSKQIAEAWGPEIARANYEAKKADSLSKFYQRLLSNRERQEEPDMAKAVANAIRRMKLDPEVTGSTLGQPYDHLDADAILATTKKLLAISRGEQEVDDRDHMAYQQVLGPEDLFAERLRKDYGGLQRQLLYKASFSGNLKPLQPGILSKQLESVLFSSGLASAAEEINPSELLDKLGKISRMGEGSITSTDAVPDEARAVQPSHFGLIDPVRTPESLKLGVDVNLASPVRKGPNGTLFAPIRNLKTGKTEWLTAQQMAKVAIAFPGEERSKSKRIGALRNGKIDYVNRDEVAYVLPDFEGAFSPLANMVPMKSASKGQRLAMASRMISQALPLEEGEAPLVRSGMLDSEDDSYENKYGEMLGALKAKQGGRVLAANKNAITVKYDDGTKADIELYDAFPFNRKTFYAQTPVVKPGDVFKPGQLLAKSNYTDSQGVTALGKNLRVGYLAFKGHNFEDAGVISESAAKKLSSEHMYQHAFERSPDHKVGLKNYVALFPGKYSKKALENMDTDGVIKEGQIVQYGDPLILAAQKKDFAHNKILKGKTAAFSDASVMWDHETPGIVTDIVKSGKTTTAVVKTLAPMEVGDKLSGRYGDKNVIAAIIPDDKMPKDAQGRPLEILANPLGIISRVNSSQIFEAALGKIAEKTGKPYNIKDFDSIEDLAQFTMKELQKHGIDDLEDVIDPETESKIPKVLVGNRFFMKLHHTAAGKEQGRSTGGYSADDTPAKGGASGCFAAKQKINTIYGPMDIAAICEKRLGVQVRTFSESAGDWVYRPVTDWFVYRSPISNLITILTEGGICEKESKVNRTRGAMYVTKNHHVFTFDGRRITAGELTESDRLVTFGMTPTQHQWEFMYGTMLGDASADLQGFSFEHSVKQIEFVAWKKSILAGLNPRQVDSTHDGSKYPAFKTKLCRSRVVYLSDYPVCDELSRCYDKNRVKTVTPEWLARLSDLSLAVWLLDDGSITNRAKKAGKIWLSGNIATHGFPAQSSQLLCDWLNNRLDTACVVNSINAINLTTDACRKLIQIVADWVPASVIPKSKKFLRNRVAEIQKVKPPQKIDSVCKLGKVPLKITSITPYKPDKNVNEINVYDFTVADTHTYVAGHALVSNSKRVALLENNALLSHGAHAVLRDASLVRGQRNEQYWANFIQGNPPPPPKIPLVYEKFIADLKGSGINVVREGKSLNILALTNKDIDELAGDRYVKSGETVRFDKAMEPIKGGLFDPTITGGHNATRWSRIKLHEPMPNPVFEEPIRRLLGLTVNQYEDVLAGKMATRYGTGPDGIAKSLEAINVDKEIDYAREQIKSGKKTHRDVAVRKLGYLKSAKAMGLHPKDWILNSVPVLPPRFRPVSVMGGKKLPLVADPNYLYKELIEANSNLKEMSDVSDDVSEERLATYNAFKAVTGLGEPVHPKLVEKNVKGLLKHVLGNSPKTGTLQRKLLSATVDITGRAVIAPNPDLDMDQIALPENMAWSLYDKFILRRLRRRGLPVSEAIDQVKNRTEIAKREMLAEMESRPVITSRAPVWHKFGIMAFYPRLTKNKVIQVSPLTVHGFTADFDGDAQNMHVPVDEDARKQAIEKMLPSRNLLSPADFKKPMHGPTQEYTGGLYAATAFRNKKEVRRFNTIEDLRKAVADGRVGINDPVEIMG